MSITEERLELLAERAKRCCCKYCGNPLEVKVISFGRINEANTEIYCPVCDRIEYGVEPEIYRNAVYFVDYIGFRYYDDFGNTEETRRLNIAKVCEIIAWNDTKIGVLDNTGYKITIKTPDEMFTDLDGSIVIKGADLDV